jgi:hypothetical protein
VVHENWFAEKLMEENAELRAVIDTLPKCWRLDEKGKLVQDCPLYPGKIVYGFHCIYGLIKVAVDEQFNVVGEWMRHPDADDPREGGWPVLEWNQCYDTLEAAEGR